jgi:hypothetical protein
MPCFQCGARQSDPARGASLWRRGVRADRQVLVCPDCQIAPDWRSALDRCASCSSAELICRLGEVECRACGHTRPADPGARQDAPAPDASPSGLAEEVAAALARVLSRRP